MHSLILMQMFIQVQETPNPDVLKFIPPDFYMNKDYFFDNMLSAKKKSPLAYILFQVDGIKNVFLSKDFISVGKTNQFDWSILKPIILNLILDFTSRNRTIIIEDEENNSFNNSADNNNSEYDIKSDYGTEEIIEQIEEILEDRIRPSVHQDGGDVTFFAFAKGIVYVKMKGACSGCPSSSQTLKMGIRNLLQYYIPEVVDVVDIDSISEQNSDK